jgi:hypothetical protein
MAKKLISIKLFIIMGLLGSSGCKSVPKPSPPQTIAQDIDMKEVENILSSHFKRKIEIESSRQLSEPERRNQVLRLYIKNPIDKIPASVILKKTVIRENKDFELERFASDFAGLKFLSTMPNLSGFVPAFYGGNVSQHFMLLEDLGETHQSLVDSLIGGDEKRAEAALHRFVISLSKLHANTFHHTEKYLQIYRETSPKPRSWQVDLKEEQEGIIRELGASLKALDLPITEAIVSEAKLVLTRNFSPGPFTTFIHGDICPDNVFDSPDNNHLYLIDFEHGKIRNALLDGSYLRMGMPTCWCAKAIPAKLVGSLEKLYRDEIKKVIPKAADDHAYRAAFEDALAFWMLNSLIPIQHLMEKDDTWGSGPVPQGSLWKPEENLVRPRIISRLQAFLNEPATDNRYMNLIKLVKDVLKQLETKWKHPKPMDFYPPFRNMDKLNK